MTETDRASKCFPAIAAYADWGVYGVCIALGLFHFYSHMRIESYAPDSSYYIGLADAILEKGSYEFNFAPHIVYPPGLPLTLAMIAFGFGSSYIVFVRSMAVIGACGLLASYALLRRIEGRTFAAAACLILGSSGFYFYTATQLVGSDIPYFLTSTLTLLFAIKLEAARLRRQRWGFSFGLGAFLVFSLLLRTVAVALLAGTGVWLIANFVAGRRDAALQVKAFTPVLLVGVLVLGAWLAWVEQAKHKGVDFGGEGATATYVDQFWAKDPHNPERGPASVTDLLARPGKNILLQGAHVAEILTRSPWLEPLWYSPVILVVMGLIAIGYRASLRGGGGITEWYFGAYVLIYLFWPFDVGPRFVFPVFPLALLYFWRGAGQLKRYAALRPAAFMGAALLTSAVLAAYSTVEVVLLRSQVSLQAKSWVIFWILSSVALGVGMASMGRKLSASLARYLESSSTGRTQRLATASAVALLVLVGFTVQVRGAIDNLTPDPKTYVHQGSKEAADWIARHTRPDDAVMAQQTAIVHRLSGRKVVYFPARSDANFIMEALRRHSVKFIVVITSSRGSNLEPTESQRAGLLKENFPHSLVLVQRGDLYEIYRVFS